MKYRIWYSTEEFADFIIDHTDLKDKECVKKKMYESDANNAKNFHTMPDHIKKILYLDAPDLIVEIDQEPIFLWKSLPKQVLGIMFSKDLPDWPHP